MAYPGFLTFDAMREAAALHQSRKADMTNSSVNGGGFPACPENRPEGFRILTYLASQSYVIGT